MAESESDRKTSKGSRLSIAPRNAEQLNRFSSVKKYFRSSESPSKIKRDLKRPTPLPPTWLSPAPSLDAFSDRSIASATSQGSNSGQHAPQIPARRHSESASDIPLPPSQHKRITLYPHSPALRPGIEDSERLRIQSLLSPRYPGTRRPLRKSSLQHSNSSTSLNSRRTALSGTTHAESVSTPKLEDTSLPYGSLPSPWQNDTTNHSPSISGRLTEHWAEMASIQRPPSSRGDHHGVPNTPGGYYSQKGSHGPPQGGTNPTNLSGLVCNVHRTTGKEPHPLVGATTTILGDKLYVFGGRMLSRTRPELTADLYELDLVRRHWSKVQTTGNLPPPRYFHSMCVLGDTKLVCFGGMSPKSSTTGQNLAGNDIQPEVVVMSDVHIYDVPSRTWTRIPTTNTPQGRYAHCAAILPSAATFSSSNAPLSAIHNNPSSTNPHQGSIGVEIDGLGGAEMVVVGGQDSSNHYIEQISVFNLRSLKWTATSPLGRSCGAYRSVVSPLTGMSVSDIGKGHTEEPPDTPSSESNRQAPGSAMLIYSNYNFLDVKLELQARLPDGQLVEKTMDTSISPPGLRFPNGGVINGHFVVSGTYLTSSKQEYALWALDLKTLTWGRIDVGGSIFGHGSWNRGVLWNRRSTFVILGHRKRSLVEDYNHRRINFSHLCMVELEAFGLYDNPRRSAPTSGYVSSSAPSLPASIQPKFSQQSAGGRPYLSAAEQLGFMAQAFTELSDMDLLTIGGERIPVNSHMLSRRWGPYFVKLLREATTMAGNSISDATTFRQPNNAHNNRNSSVTITPSIGNNSQYSTATTLVNQPSSTLTVNDHKNNSTPLTPPVISNLEAPSAHGLVPTSRPRTLYLPHTYLTVQLLVHFLYTSTLPPAGSPLCTPQILCSLLQLARPYQVDGLLEATVERLHQVLDGRNAAAVFNAAAMAAGGGRGTGFTTGSGGTLELLNGSSSPSVDLDGPAGGRNITSTLRSSSSDNDSVDRHTIATRSGSGSGSGNGISSSSSSHRHQSSSQRPSNLRINTDFNPARADGHPASRDRAESVGSASTATSASTNESSMNLADADIARQTSYQQSQSRGRPGREVWTADISSVVGLQKRGLRGLMEGRRMRERGVTTTFDGNITAGTGAATGGHNNTRSTTPSNGPGKTGLGIT